MTTFSFFVAVSILTLDPLVRFMCGAPLGLEVQRTGHNHEVCLSVVTLNYGLYLRYLCKVKDHRLTPQTSLIH